MAKEKKETAKKEMMNRQAFIQRKLMVLNKKNGGRYERDAARVVQNNQ